MNHLSGLPFRGLPLPGTLRIASRADSGYIASLFKGFIPAVCNLLWAVKYVIPSLFANSFTVNPLMSTSKLSENIFKKLSKIYIFTIDKYLKVRYYYV